MGSTMLLLLYHKRRLTMLWISSGIHQCWSLWHPQGSSSPDALSDRLGSLWIHHDTSYVKGHVALSFAVLIDHHECLFLRYAFLGQLPTDVRLHLVHDKLGDITVLSQRADEIYRSLTSFPLLIQWTPWIIAVLLLMLPLTSSFTDLNVLNVLLFLYPPFSDTSCTLPLVSFTLFMMVLCQVWLQGPQLSWLPALSRETKAPADGSFYLPVLSPPRERPPHCPVVPSSYPPSSSAGNLSRHKRVVSQVPPPPVSS